MLKKDSHCIYLSVVLIDSVFKMGKNYYTQVFLEECKYTVKEKEATRNIAEDFEISSDHSDKFDKEYFFFNKRSKKSHEHQNFALCKLLSTLNYTLNYTLN